MNVRHIQVQNIKVTIKYNNRKTSKAKVSHKWWDVIKV